MKRILYSLQLILAATISLTTLSSCNEKVISTEIITSTAGFTLDASGNDQKVITITSTESWEATCAESWITLTPAENTLTISATANTDLMVRSAVITISSANGSETIKVSQAGHSSQFVVGSTDELFLMGVISPSAFYIAASQYNALIGMYEICRVNTKTGEFAVLGRYPGTEAPVMVSAVDDFGNVFTSDELGWNGAYFTADGELRQLALPEGIAGGAVNDTSTDGYIWVGTGTLADGGVTALKWVNGEPIKLDRPEPQTVPGTTDQHWISMWDALGCSNDGSIVYGRCLDDQAVFYWDANNEGHYASLENTVISYHNPDEPSWGVAYNGPILYKDLDKISANGRYIGCNFGYNGTLVIDTQEGTATEYDGISTAILNDGTVVTLNQSMYYPSMVHLPSGEVVSGDDFIFNELGALGIAGAGIKYMVENEAGELQAVVLFKGDDRGYTFDYIIRK